MKKITTVLLILFATLTLFSCVKVSNKVPSIDLTEVGLDTTNPAKWTKEVLEGTNFDPLAGAKATDVEDGTLTLEVTNPFPGAQFKTVKAGTEFDVTYTATDSKGAVVSQKITVLVVRADSLTITPPTKTSYDKGEPFLRAGIVVVANYKGTHVTLANGEYIINDEQNLTNQSGNPKVVTVSGAGTTGQFNISVSSDEFIEGLVSISAGGSYSLTYRQGSSFDYSKLIITATFADSHTEVIPQKANGVDGYEASGFTSKDAGSTTINISYAQASTSISLVITPATAPWFTGINPIQNWYMGMAPWDPLAGVKAVDAYDGDITANIVVSGIKLTTFSVPGETTITLTITNSAGISKTENIQLTVVLSAIPVSLEAAGSTASNPITISLAHGMGADIEAKMKNYATDFENFYKAKGIYIKINVETGAGGYDALKENVSNRITAQNDIPNIVQGYPDHVAEYLTSKAVVALDPYIENSIWGLGKDWGFSSVEGYNNKKDSVELGETFEDIIESYRTENSQYDEFGTFYSLPFNKSTEVMTYNKTAFDALGLAAPVTWQDLIAMAPALRTYGEQKLVDKLSSTASDADKTTARNRFVPAAYDSLGNGFITFTRQLGGAYTGYDTTTKKGSLLWNSSQATVTAMEFVKSLGRQTDGGGNKILVVPEFWSQSYASTPFAAGETFVTVGSSAGVRYNKPADDSFVLGVAPVPYDANHSDLRQVIQQGTNLSVLAGTSTTEYQKLVSFLFIKWLVRGENTIDLAISTGYLPVRESAYISATFQHYLSISDAPYGSAAYLELSPADRNAYFNSLSAKAAYAQRDYMFSDPAFPGSSKARLEVGSAFSRILIGDGNIQDALQKAYDNANL